MRPCGTIFVIARHIVDGYTMRPRGYEITHEHIMHTTYEMCGVHTCVHVHNARDGNKMGVYDERTTHVL